MKKWMLLFVACILLFVGCQENESDGVRKEGILNNQDVVVIEIWTYYNSRAQEVLDSYIKKFNETVGITKGVIVRQVAFGEIKALTDALGEAGSNTGSRSKMPDLFITYKGIAATLPVCDDLIDFKDYIGEEEFALYVDAFVKSGSLPNYPDKYLMFSLDKASEVLMINETLFDEYAAKGIVNYDDLKTYEGLAAAAKKYYEYTDSLTETPNDGKALFGANAIVNLLWLSMAEMGQDITKIENGKEVITLDREAFQRFYDYIFIPYVKGYFDNKNKYVTDDIRIGHSLIGQSSTSSSPFFPKQIQGEETMIPITAKVMPLPVFEGTEKKILIQGGGVFGYKRSEKSAVASVVFLKWLTNEENALDFAIKKSYMPALKSEFDKKKIRNASDEGKIDKLTADTFTMLIDLFDGYEVYEPTPSEHYEEVRAALSKYINASRKAAREEYLSLLETGVSTEEAGAKFECKEAFDAWFSELNDIIKHIKNKTY